MYSCYYIMAQCKNENFISLQIFNFRKYRHISQQIVYHTLKTCVKSALFSVIEHCLPEASVLPSCDLFKNGLQDRPKGCI